MSKISLEPALLFLRRGPLLSLLRQPLLYTEWVWVTDACELIFGNGITVGGVRGFYAGGQIMTQTRNPRFDRPILAIPPYARRADREGCVLAHGQVLYDRDERWIYVGDGQRPGGVRAR